MPKTVTSTLISYDKTAEDVGKLGYKYQLSK